MSDTPTPYSEPPPSVASHSGTTPSKALKRQSRVSPGTPPLSSSVVRHRHVTPLLTESEPMTEIDGDGIRDPGPSSSVYSTAGTSKPVQTREGADFVASGLQGEKEKTPRTPEVKKDECLHTSVEDSSQSDVAVGGGVHEGKAQSYKYDTCAFPVREFRVQITTLCRNSVVSI